MPDSNSSVPESTIPVLARPEFKSQIPSHLLEGANEQDRYLLEQLSRMNQYMEWSANAHILTHDQVRKTNGRLLKAESNITEFKEEKARWTYSAKTLVAVAGGIAGLVSTFYAVYKALNGGN